MSWTKKDQSIPMVLDEAPVAFFPASCLLQGPRTWKSQVPSLQQLRSTAEPRHARADQVHLSQ